MAEPCSSPIVENIAACSSALSVEPDIAKTDYINIPGPSHDRLAPVKHKLNELSRLAEEDTSGGKDSFLNKLGLDKVDECVEETNEEDACFNNPECEDETWEDCVEGLETTRHIFEIIDDEETEASGEESCLGACEMAGGPSRNTLPISTYVCTTGNSKNRSLRKRKLDAQIGFPCKKLFPDAKTAHSMPSASKTICDKFMSIMQATATQTESFSSSDKLKQVRSFIPTKDNPPPGMSEWLSEFQRWSNAERILAIDQLIERCELTQVRHMMQVIEPQFQRDFISLLPKELALTVLSFLEPRDLLRAAQTCRNWRFLAEDNLLWKEKCKDAGIEDMPRKGRGRNSPNHTSSWKAAYMRQYQIEMNWRIKPIRPPKVLKGHDDHVITCLQFSGNKIVSGSDDNTLKVWSASTGKCLRTLVGHTGGVWSSQMAGSIIISGSTDRTLKVWNADSGQCIHTLYGHTSTVRCMHLHDNKVVSGSRDATLRVWDIESGECLHILVGHLAAVRCVQYDGRLVVSGAYDYMVKVWNPEREECLHTLQGHTNRVYSLQFDGVHVVSGSLDTSIRVWEVETGACRHTLMGHQSLTSGPNKHQSAVTCLQFNNRFVITSSDDGTVKLWDVRTGEFIRNLVALDSGGSGGVVWRIRASDTKLVCAVGSRNARGSRQRARTVSAKQEGSQWQCLAGFMLLIAGEADGSSHSPFSPEIDTFGASPHIQVTFLDRVGSECGSGDLVCVWCRYVRSRPGFAGLARHQKLNWTVSRGNNSFLGM
ncbi:archipelago [Carabus blaptoides fortunei]